MPEPPSTKDISLTFAKGLEVLESFGEGEGEMTISEIARTTGLNRTVV
ncbi:MAG: helix-turn-helix domain-containing protein, partial [Gammaproteobacteria bacterium]|nr:helix-turn-helix domain-containing protein [Gammaproteobacteria bacterium]